MNHSMEHVAGQSDKLNNSPVSDESKDDVGVADDANTKAQTCKWNGKDYTHGATVCVNHQKYICSTAGSTPTWFKNGSC